MTSAWPLRVSLFFTLLSLAALGLYGFNMVLVYLSALSAVASIMFWRESSPARGDDNRESRDQQP